MIGERAIEIRPLSYRDLQAVMEIERRSFTAPWSLPMFALELSKRSGICLAAFDGGRLAGYLFCAHYEEAWHLMNVAVDPGRRRSGVARALITEMLARTGADANITLEVRVSNAAAITLYESYDFRRVGIRKRYYADNGEDAVIMWRALGEPWLGR